MKLALMYSIAKNHKTMELFTNVNQLKHLLDKVILETLQLIEDDLTLKINIEKLTNEGALNLAKTRYTQGTNSVSISQLPTDDDKEFNALKTVSRNVDVSSVVEFSLESHNIDKEKNYIDPINWFGILTPQALKDAREKYQKSIELSVEAVNIRSRISKNVEIIEKLRNVKLEFERNEE